MLRILGKKTSRCHLFYTLLIIRCSFSFHLLHFSDSNWDWVDEKTKKAMGLEKSDDGEFWMPFKDFCHQFQELTICTTGPDFDGDGISDKAGKCTATINFKSVNYDQLWKLIMNITTEFVIIEYHILISHTSTCLCNNVDI